MRLAVVQTNPIFGEVKSNVRAALALMESVEADLYVLPELFNTGYNFIDAEEVSKLSESRFRNHRSNLSESLQVTDRAMLSMGLQRRPIESTTPPPLSAPMA